MKRLILTAALCAALAWPAVSPSVGQHFGGRPGAGGARPPAQRPVTPSFQRPAPQPAARPNFRPPTGARPGIVPSAPGGNFRPSVTAPRPTPGGLTRPNLPASPGIQRPNLVNRPAAPQITPPTATRPAPGFNPPGAGNRPGGLVPQPGFNRPAVRPNPLPAGPGLSRPGLVNRPGRPGQDGGIITRPGQGGGGVQWPNRPNRPDWVNRPNNGNNIINRPNLNIGNRPINNNVNNINVNRWNQWNQRVNANRLWWNRPAYWNRPWYGGRPAWYWGRPYYWQHWNWHRGYWNYWNTVPSVWLGTGLAAGALLSPGDTFVYSNPYYVVPTSTTVVVPQYLDYSAPLQAPPADLTAYAYPPAPPQGEGESAVFSTEAPPAPQTDDPAVSRANALLDQARDVFKRGDYAQAQALVEQAIASLPSDATLHEFRALTLFAQGKYQEAAAALYAVLAAGPGWDWATMVSLYPDADTYTRQLRALEAYVRAHPAEGDAHFLLAYHYLVLGNKDAAVQQLREVVRLVPQDKLSASLLQALTAGTPAGGPAAPPAPGAEP
jgi:tetratricopeptide (TPR) repeat protein